MKKLTSILFGTAIALSSASSAFAAQILYYEDYTSGTSAVTGALTASGYDATTTTVTSVTDFNSQLSSGSWDLVIFGEQGNSQFPSAPNLSTYVSGGGLVLGTTWRDDGFATLMEGSRLSTNDLTITSDTHAIFAGLGATVEITNPGWSIYSTSWSADGTAECLGTLGAGCAAILGNSGNTLLLGPLFDSFSNLSEGELLVGNSIDFLLNGSASPIPEPASLALLGLGIAGLGFSKRRKVKA